MAIEVGKIPTAPGIKLENLIDFKENCIEPLALAVITEALDYALETSARRLESLGKIFSQVEKSAYNSGKGVIPTIKAVREAFQLAPQCTPEGPKVMPPPVTAEEAIVAEARKAPKEVKALPEIEAMLETLPKDVREKAKAEYKKLLLEAVPVVPPPEPTREQPTLWGKVFFHGEGKEAGLTGEYDSPADLAKVLKLETEPRAKTQVKLFERAGFQVKGNGEEPFKTEEGIGFHVKRIAPTPSKYQLKVPELEAPGVPLLPPLVKPRPKEVKEPVGVSWMRIIKKDTKETVGWDPIDPKTGLAIREKRVLVGSKEAKKAGLE